MSYVATKLREQKEIEAAVSDCLSIDREYKAATKIAQAIHTGTVIALCWVLSMPEGDALTEQLLDIRALLATRAAKRRRRP